MREAGGWVVLPVLWPDPAAFHVGRRADAFILHTGSGAAASAGSNPSIHLLGDPVLDELTHLLLARPNGAPLIVFGHESGARAEPTCWLPAMPSAALLGAMLNQLVTRVDEAANTASLGWHRKTDMIIGHSPAIQQLLQSLEQLAPAQTPVIITGESGSGKELFARALHFCSPRAQEPFIAINCAAIPENLFEAELFGYVRGAFTGAVQNYPGAIDAAHKGTLFLDEIGEMPLSLQAKLLRVLETSEVQRIGSTERKKVNFRLVSATNRKLERDVKEGRFREDLYYRVRVYPLHVPPLRERPEDISPIVIHHLTAIAQRENRPALRLTAAALEKLIGYNWPGNVRELINLLERAVVLAEGNVIDAAQIILPHASPIEPASGSSSFTPYKVAKQRFEQDYYAHLMRTSGSNISLAAKLSQKTRKEIYDALKRLDLEGTRVEAEAGAGSGRTARGRASVGSRHRHARRPRA
ncbi:MAG TPA: sigma-54 dependent transcriptional regulator [Kofleriaceae bacterium]|nr:sigma-54 dependent transcriptional regulator [Kofleriaceae bacterium]